MEVKYEMKTSQCRASRRVKFLVKNLIDVGIMIFELLNCLLYWRTFQGSAPVYGHEGSQSVAVFVSNHEKRLKIILKTEFC